MGGSYSGLVYRRTRATLCLHVSACYTQRTLQLSADESATADTPFVAARVESSRELVLFEDSNLAKRKLSHR